MRRKTWVSGLGAVVVIGAVLMLLTTFASAASSGGAAHVRWDIISTSGIPPAPLNPGGHASAMAPDGDTITLTPNGTSLQLPGILTVFCVIGPHAPQSVLGPLTEGVTLNVPGIQNFNHSNGGDNRYVQIS